MSYDRHKIQRLLLLFVFCPSLLLKAQNTIRTVILNATQIPKTLKYKGKLAEAHQWVDNLGENILILSKTGPYTEKEKGEDGEPVKSAELFAYHFYKKDTGYKILWRLNDIEKKCEFDIDADFITGATGITDLDKDGVAETTVQYKLACRSDVSPSTMKMIIHEDSVKYALRGYMWIKSGEKEAFSLNDKNLNLEKLPKQKDEYENMLQSYGRYENEKDFKSAPVEFLNFARQRWLKFVKETF